MSDRSSRARQIANASRDASSDFEPLSARKKIVRIFHEKS
jgi:hypothetical protein